MVLYFNYLSITHFRKIQTSYNEKDGNAFRDSAVEETENFMINSAVNTPPSLTFYPQTLPLTSQNLQGELPALSQNTFQQPPALASSTSKGPPRALSVCLSLLSSEEVIPTLSKRALQELLPIFRKHYLQSEPTELLNCTPRRRTLPSQGIIQTTMNFALLIPAYSFMSWLSVCLYTVFSFASNSTKMHMIPKPSQMFYAFTYCHRVLLFDEQTLSAVHSQ